MGLQWELGSKGEADKNGSAIDMLLKVVLTPSLLRKFTR